jgi:hypothetical protein
MSSPKGGLRDWRLEGFLRPMPRRPRGDQLRALIREAIEEMAARGRVVIVAHAARSRFWGRRTCSACSSQPRLRRGRAGFAAARGLDDAEAAREIRAADAARAEYLNRFYGVRRELPTQYDLVVNTDVLSVEQAVALLVEAATS